MKSWKEHKKRYIIILLGIVIITGVIAWNKYIDPKLKYDHMLDEFSSKHYVEAQIIADDLAGYKDSSTYSLECEYQLAVIKMGKTDTLENAKKSFENIITYKDSEKLRDDCCYMLEKEAYEQGDFKKVMEYYEMLPEDYEADSEDYNPEDINMTSKWIDQLQGTWKCLNQIAG